MPEPSQRPSPPVVTWIHHPAAQRPLALLGVALLIGGLGAGVFAVEENIVLGAVVVIFLTAAVSPFLLPTRYTLTSSEVIEQRALGTRRRKLEELRRWVEDAHGILLSPFAEPSPLDERRGLYLRGGERADIREHLTRAIGPAAEK